MQREHEVGKKILAAVGGLVVAPFALGGSLFCAILAASLSSLPANYRLTAGLVAVVSAIASVVVLRGFQRGNGRVIEAVGDSFWTKGIGALIVAGCMVFNRVDAQPLGLLFLLGTALLGGALVAASTALRSRYVSLYVDFCRAQPIASVSAAGSLEA